jgi:colanic acid/amylovoran biosynthesis protein
VRILVEPGSYRCQNMGDVAMLQVAVARLREVFPGADIRVLTNAPDALATYCPGVRPLAASGRAPWLRGPDTGRALWVRGMLASTRTALVGGDPRPVWRFADALRRADLLLIAGQGSMGDATIAHARIVLATLRLARSSGVPTAMMGQGVGPMRDGALLREAADVLPEVGLIATREGSTGPGLLRSLGVPSERIKVTGDDAIELASREAQPELGRAIGVNVRVAPNAGVQDELIGPIGDALRLLARSLQAPLLPIPIARGQAKDAAVLQAVLGGDPSSPGSGADLDSPAKVIRQVGRCRVVVTGAYHAAVFALAQGLPVVFLAESEYYHWKARGLAEEFGVGCEVLSVGGPTLADQIGMAVRRVWDQAEQTRPALLASAARQVATGRQAYEALRDLASRRPLAAVETS